MITKRPKSPPDMLRCLLPEGSAQALRAALESIAADDACRSFMPPVAGVQDLEDWCCRYIAVCRTETVDKALVDALLEEDPWPLRLLLRQAVAHVLDGPPGAPDEPPAMELKGDGSEDDDEGDEDEEYSADGDAGAEPGEDRSGTQGEHEKSQTEEGGKDTGGSVSRRNLPKRSGKQDMRLFAAMLRAKLQALLFTSFALERRHPGRRGRLQPQLLNRIAAGNPRVFLGKRERPRWDCAIHILLDSSGSMAGAPIALASGVCHALALALHPIPGVRVAASHYPSAVEGGVTATLLHYGERPLSEWSIDGDGGNPDEQALLEVVAMLRRTREQRKIILFITDGICEVVWPEDFPLEIQQGQIEIYGVGIKVQSILETLPERSEVIQELPELAPALARLLQKAMAGLLGPTGRHDPRASASKLTTSPKRLL